MIRYINPKYLDLNYIVDCNSNTPIRLDFYIKGTFKERVNYSHGYTFQYVYNYRQNLKVQNETK